QEDKPPAAESQDAPAPTAQQDAPDPPAEVQDTQAPTAEQEDKPPAAEPQDTPPEAPDQQASKSAAADSQGDEVPKVKPPAARKAGKPGGAPKAPQSPGRGRSAGPRPTRRKPGKPPKGPSVVIRYGLMGHIGQFRHNLQPPPARGINVVVRTDRGVELGEVVTVVSDEPDCPYITPKRLEEHIAANGPDYPFRRDGKVLRLANPQDLIDQRHLNSSAKDEQKFCAQELKEMKLDMKLVAVEHLLGGERIIFYFLAEHRVDFRELVHKLANQYHTRIEMRQVGARDEARLVGDYEHCGQECCCKQFLKGLQPVSMRMAKTQKATLDPSKISGRCGRLMCCLRYEDQCYRDLKKCLPHKNIWVKTRDQIGRVTGTQILTQLVQVQLPDGSRGLFANEDIIERNVDPPPPPPAHTPRPTRQTARKTDRGRKRQDSAPSGQQAKPAADKKTPKPQRDTKPPRERRPKPAPRPDPQPRATAETLDPGWAGLLGDGVVENDSAPTSQPAADPQASPTTPPAEEPQASPQDQATTDPPPQTPHPVPEPTQPQAQAPAEQSGEAPKPAGEKRRKRRRRRGRKSRGKQQGN
ncbi:MAG: regulatory iron-sulfur-containing complex subunit RicT, partial [Phycisphaerae bacterium]|nr:regulatory iron-sulfur-containing complex subunit RicT [Phycisphaerae bacterium]